MQHKMRYRLGLDLGTTSIGWALIRLNDREEPCAVIRMGSRIFSDGRNPKDGSSLAVTRRLARQMRRRRDRLLKRKCAQSVKVRRRLAQVGLNHHRQRARNGERRKDSHGQRRVLISEQRRREQHRAASNEHHAEREDESLVEAH